MKRFFWITLVSLLLATGHPLALELTALAPSRGAPGTLVAIDGGPFSAQAQPVLGEQALTPRRILDTRLEFTVPIVPPGEYLLSVHDGSTVATQTYQFEVMAPTPRIESIEPRNLDLCAVEREHLLQVEGRNFLPGAVLLMNEIVVPTEVHNDSSLEARLPPLQKPGVYGVVVRNPDGASSLPHSLWVNSIPEITSVERGDDFVNNYEVIIHGKNFFFNSTLVVKEPEDSTIGLAYRQFSFTSRSSTASQGTETVAPQRDRLVFVDCQTLIYHRYPSNNQSKELGLQVLNPDGQGSDLYFATLP